MANAKNILPLNNGLQLELVRFWSTLSTETPLNKDTMFLCICKMKKCVSRSDLEFANALMSPA
jgi:hypothetical protein